MAYNTGYVAELQSSLRHRHDDEVRTIAESPNIGENSAGYNSSKRPRTESPPLFGPLDPISAPHSMSLTLGLETKKLIVSTCHAIVKLELTNSKLDAKICDFEEHNHNGTIPKDLLLPKKK